MIPSKWHTLCISNGCPVIMETFYLHRISHLTFKFNHQPTYFYRLLSSLKTIGISFFVCTTIFPFYSPMQIRISMNGRNFKMKSNSRSSTTPSEARWWGNMTSGRTVRYLEINASNILILVLVVFFSCRDSGEEYSISGLLSTFFLRGRWRKKLNLK